MKLFLHLFFLLFCLNTNAQYLLSSNTTVESCNDVEDCLTVNNFSYLYYDESKNEFFLKVDFNDFRSATDTSNNWLNRPGDSCLYFRVIFLKEQFPDLSNENSKTYKLNGRIFYNNKWKDQPVDLTLYSSQNGFIDNTSGNTNYRYDKYKVNFTLPFIPAEFKYYKELYYYNQTVSINVTLGRINMLKPGMESLLSDIYYQPNR